VPGLEETFLKDGTVSDKLGQLLDGTLEQRVLSRWVLGLV
jgi:hypothetical protein